MSDPLDPAIATVNALVGRAWELGGFDCWGFIRVVYSAAYGIGLPALPGVDGSDHRASAQALATCQRSGDWQPVTSIPLTGDVVIMGRRARPHHVGLWLACEGGVIAHCDQEHGVIVQTRRQIVAGGWGGFAWYRHLLKAGDP